MSYAPIMYPLIQRGLISTCVEVSRRSYLCCIQCSLSKQVRMTLSGERGKKRSTWISLEFPVVSLWTQSRNECTGPPGQRSGEFQAQQIKAWLRGASGIKLQQEKSALLLVTPDTKCVGCWRNSSEVRVADAPRKERKERIICIGVCVCVCWLQTRHLYWKH